MSDPDITITNITAGDIAEFRTLLGKLGDGDITTIRVLVDDTDYIARLADNPELRWIARDTAGTIVGYATVNRLPGWSDHVGELRLVVDPDVRQRPRTASSSSTPCGRRSMPGCARWWWN